MAVNWEKIKEYEDIVFERSLGDASGIAKVTINRPDVRNAFRPKTVIELRDAFSHARDDSAIGVVVLTGAGDEAFCSGGDQRVRGEGGYVGDDGIPRLNVLDLQREIRGLPKPVIAMVAGYAIGGGHVLHLVCDVTIAAEHARFGQAGPRVGSFDAGFGTSYLARVVGEKRAREIWLFCRQYDAHQAEQWGLVNKVVPAESLMDEARAWGREAAALSPTVLRFLKASFNADSAQAYGQGKLAFTGLDVFGKSEEAREGRGAFAEKRDPDFSKFR